MAKRARLGVEIQKIGRTKNRCTGGDDRFGEIPAKRLAALENREVRLSLRVVDRAAVHALHEVEKQLAGVECGILRHQLDAALQLVRHVPGHGGEARRRPFVLQRSLQFEPVQRKPGHTFAGGVGVATPARAGADQPRGVRPNDLVFLQDDLALGDARFRVRVINREPAAVAVS